MAKTNWIVDDDYWKPLPELGKTASILKPGLYEVEHQESMFGSGTALKAIEPKTDNLLPLEGSLAAYMVESVQSFWESAPRYAEMGLVHKRGILMEGAPGTGKTAICMIAAQEVAKKGGVGMFVAPKTRLTNFPAMLKRIREIHPDLPILTILEDIDVHQKDMYLLLALLDGELQIPNVVYVGTTNYIDKLDARLTNRPSRFDEVIKVRPPVSKARSAYFRAILPTSVEESTIEALVAESRGLNFSHLKELAISNYVYGRDPKKIATRLRALGSGQGVGFGEAED